MPKNITDLSWGEISEFLMNFQEFAVASGIDIYDTRGKLRDFDTIANLVIDDLLKSCTEEAKEEPESPTEMVNHPAHYNQGKRECIEEMELLFGPEDVAGFCRCSAYKYRTRAGTKPGNSREQDLAKVDWYIDYLDDMMKRYAAQPEPVKIGFALTKNTEVAA